MAVAAAVQGAVALWWWALADMSEKVGMAHTITVWALGSSAALLIMEGKR